VLVPAVFEHGQLRPGVKPSGDFNMHIRTRCNRHSLIARTALSSLYLCSLLAILPAIVIAGTGPSKVAETASVKISFTGLDLATPAGLSTAHVRLAAAAHQACQRFSDSRKVDDRETFGLCYRITLANAIQHLNGLLVAAGAIRSEVAKNIP
jgi:UrcA family protein